MDSEEARSGGRTDVTRVRDVVRDVVAEVAPEELPLVAGLAGFDDATAVRRLGGRARRRDTLGFGLGEVAALVTPVVWLAVDQAAQRIAGAAVDGAAAGARSALRKLLRRPAEDVTVPSLTREQLAEVRESVLAMAAQRGLEEERAVTIAEAVVARLALGPPEDSGPELTGPGSPTGPGNPAGAPDAPDAAGGEA
ncbi:hypothetical protein ACIQ9Q_25575 [Streptomyces sp. NPDC094438]|uniref:hypothetical protein n=1 Tax=Streptomyces sp. NPDC094438 TaxID=3366061 RepID=UPI00382134F5